MSEQLNLFDDLSFYEGPDVEYKAGKGGLPSDLWETYSAFANSQGGVIWLGISQKSGRLDIHGVPNPEKLVSDFWNTVNNRGKVNINLLTNSDVSIVPIADKAPVVRISVPHADRRQKPVFVGNDPLRGTFRRNYEGDYRCTEAEVRRMFADQSDEPADSRILDGFPFEDLHLESLRQFRNRFASRTPHPWLAEDDKGLLEKLGGWRRDRASGREGLTVAGLLMFGREQAIRDPSAVPGFHLDYREHYSDDPSVRWTDRLTLDGTWEGNLFQFYQQVMLKLSTGPGIRRPFQTDAEGYRVTGTPVVEALQEALVNALIHADYAGQGGIVIDRWVDRLEFSNPGTLLVSREQLLRGSVSECRNKSLQLMFQMLGAGDKAGSGIDKIRSSWMSEHWQSPSLSERHGPDRVVLLLPMLSTLPEAALEALRGRFGARFENLTPDEVHAVVTAYVEGEVTNLRLQDMLTLHRVDITRMLRGLVQKGLLVSDGAGRGTRYGIPALEGDAASPLSDTASPPRDAASPLSMSIPEGAHAEPAVMDEVLWHIAEPIRKQPRAKPELMKKTILALCEVEFLSLQQLATLLGRSSTEKLRENYVGPLVSEGRLTLRYPEAARHSEQAYRTVRLDEDKVSS
jgi:ATP-dependent DNA helicase RecG